MCENEIQEVIEPQVAEPQADKKGKPKKTLKQEIISWVVTIVTAVALALVIRTFIFEPIRVDGSSMADTLQNGEITFTFKTGYLFNDPQRHDVVICRYPNRSEYFVKRVMGVPGDTIAILGSTVYINGTAVEEPYLNPARNQYNHTMSPITLGENEYFVVGDNRYNSHDSRDWNDNDPSRDVGPISKDMIIGRVRYVFWPLNEMRVVE